jgi:transposase
VDLSDKQLILLLYPPVEKQDSPLETDIEYVYSEIKKKGVTLMLLSEEYKEKSPNGIRYTQYCEGCRKFKNENLNSLLKYL